MGLLEEGGGEGLMGCLGGEEKGGGGGGGFLYLCRGFCG